MHWLKIHLYFSSWLKGPNIIYANPRLYSTLTENVKSVILHYGRNRIIKIRSFNYKWHLPLWSRLLLYPAGVRGRMKTKPPLEQPWHRSHGEVLPVSLGNVSVCLFLSNCNNCNILQWGFSIHLKCSAPGNWNKASLNVDTKSDIMHLDLGSYRHDLSLLNTSFLNVWWTDTIRTLGCCVQDEDEENDDVKIRNFSEIMDSWDME